MRWAGGTPVVAGAAACLGLATAGVSLPQSLAVLAAPARQAPPISFNRDIRPILADNCFACHGPDDKHRMANLRLDTEDGLFANRGSSRVQVAATDRIDIVRL